MVEGETSGYNNCNSVDRGSNDMIVLGVLNVDLDNG